MWIKWSGFEPSQGLCVALYLFFKLLLISQQLHTAKELMTDWLQLIADLSLQRDKLTELASSQNEREWRQEVDKAQNLKVGGNIYWSFS